MKVGVIGTGSMGKNHARVYSELKGIDEVYAFDLNKDSVNSLKELDVISCDSMEDLLNNVDAVSICVPTKHHIEVAQKAIKNKVHCLIEKPIALKVDEAKDLIDSLKDVDLIVGIGQIERFNPIVNEIKKMIKNPFYVEMKRHNPASSRITDSSVIEDLMIHDIDIIFNILFDEKDYDVHRAGNDDVCKALFTFKNSIVSISASRKASKKIRSVYIEDDGFTIEGDFMTQEIYAYHKPDKYRIENDRYNQENIIEKVLVNKVEPLKIELKTFVDCIKRNVEFPVTPNQALNNLMICEEIKKGL